MDIFGRIFTGLKGVQVGLQGRLLAITVVYRPVLVVVAVLVVLAAEVLAAEAPEEAGSYG